MLTRVSVAVALGSILLAGCGRGGGAKKSNPPTPGMSSVTLHVDRMTERLKLT